ncbi:TPA: hypothetical protein DDW69_03695 [candidate division CPR2 bacterium]|uniref:Uncharacterized protein n=1 Tax=candidate division CPR2 bacterium GW2011_GWC1_41_48 TaxID=1618344 RepID=A0A0G0WAA7_UNCC2|nr:MAG: hypothetical protein UT47_C0003G0068 [candidate division CPR2 bacterium GW2011_GWC2_39_35]KKR29352.1 MAG: hypothetical protein UT60_C0003G0029 [candidate division CPR2 bacterium GW2011_GWD2_39_7]KKS09007.1 MAG: hypothetical protein UU65_C0003G0062 [candidate division CPR2 bacterium GW2011_GWC1_41_48]OGB71174.1 MAG: hypothetical protein A2Y26_04150 [candidate division CPR2 bacterium GWD2_39_7]HBG81918.1 hypothetical protein [candidate division CPR2 bacterium]
MAKYYIGIAVSITMAIHGLVRILENPTLIREGSTNVIKTWIIVNAEWFTNGLANNLFDWAFMPTLIVVGLASAAMQVKKIKRFSASENTS